MKYMILVIFILFLAGCKKTPPTDTYVQFVKDHKSKKAFICENGFLTKQNVVYWQDYIVKDLVRNDAGIPTRCTDNVTVEVRETVATGALSGDTN